MADDLDRLYIPKLIDEASAELHSRGSLIDRTKKIIKRDVLRRDVQADDLIRWPKGMLLLGLLRAGQTDVVCGYLDKWIESGAIVSSLEDVLACQVMLEMTVSGECRKDGRYAGGGKDTADSVHELITDGKYKRYCDRAACFIDSYERDGEGSLPYSAKAQNDHIYADSIGMICPFLVMYGQYTGESGYIDLATLQMINFMNNAFDDASGLPYHGYRCKDHEKYGMIGWGRAVGWLMMGMAGCLASGVRSGRMSEINRSYGRLSESVLRCQRADGLWGWNLQDPESQTDTSASAMILYSLSIYKPEDQAERSSECISKGAASLIGFISKDGKVMQGQAECGGFGIYPERFGSYPWSVGMTLAFMSEYGK